MAQGDTFNLDINGNNQQRSFLARERNPVKSIGAGITIQREGDTLHFVASGDPNAPGSQYNQPRTGNEDESGKYFQQQGEGVEERTPPVNKKHPEWGKDGLRADGTPKGNGWLGVHKMTDGSNRVMSEYTIGIDINGVETEIPTLVPTLTKDELNHLLAGNPITPAIKKKAIDWGTQRIAHGFSPFITDQDLITQRLDEDGNPLGEGNNPNLAMPQEE